MGTRHADEAIHRHAVPVRQRLKDHYVPEITAIRHEGELVEPPTPLPWYPDQLAWQMTTSKNVIRRFPPFASFQKFLVSETSVGNINRQEAVSMIPPLLMDVKPGMTVLDMCAAPGSKACQLIELLHEGEEARIEKQQKRTDFEDGRRSPLGDELGEDWSDDGRATGLLIANDMDYKRAHMLIHQMKRLNSPNLIVTNHDASMFPSIKLRSKPGAPAKQYLKFDRILADVPCSGDGTGRKSPNIWRDWKPANGMGLHNLQLRILIRAMQMLKIGGRVVYSTCSMNPVENEAVVASAVAACGGHEAVELVDCSDKLPELKRRPGLSNWQVMDKSGRMWSSWTEAENHIKESGIDSMGKMAQGLFPPSGVQEYHLDRCMRVYPHLQDTGGFFITILEKKKAISTVTQPQNQVQAPQPSITSTVNEIEARTESGVDPSSRIEALDRIMPEVPADRDAEGVTAAARQNMENAPIEPVTATKRAFDEQGDARAENKRLKMRDDKDADYPAIQGGEDRQVHYPPPPGAALDVSRPETIDEPSPNLQPGHLVPDDTTSQPIASQSSQPPTQIPTRNPLPREGKPPFEEPFKYLPYSHPILSEISTFYSLSPSFPRDRFMVRNAAGVPAKTIYYTSSLARDILTTNAGTGLKFVHCGIKMFQKQDTQGEGVCAWRIQNEGMPLLERFVGEERVVRCWRRGTLKKLLMEMFPKVGGEGWRDLGEVGLQVKDKPMGCLVLRVETKQPEGGDAMPNGDTKPEVSTTAGNDEEAGHNEEENDHRPFSDPMVLPLWRSLHSVNLMSPKEERKAMLLRLFGVEMTEIKDTSKDRFEKRKLQQQQEQKQEQQQRTESTNDEMDGNGNGNGKGHGIMQAGNAPPDMPDGLDDIENDLEDIEARREESRRNTSSAEIEVNDDRKAENNHPNAAAATATATAASSGGGGGRDKKVIDGVAIAKSGDLDHLPGKEAGDLMDVDDPQFPNTGGGLRERD